MATSKAKYQKKLKCSNVNSGVIQSIITFIEEQPAKDGPPVVRSGVTVTLHLTNAAEAKNYLPGETYTVTIE